MSSSPARSRKSAGSRSSQNVVTYITVVDVPNPQLKLKPGMTATVSIEVAGAPAACCESRTPPCGSDRRARSPQRWARPPARPMAPPLGGRSDDTGRGGVGATPSTGSGGATAGRPEIGRSLWPCGRDLATAAPPDRRNGPSCGRRVVTGTSTGAVGLSGPARQLGEDGAVGDPHRRDHRRSRQDSEDVRRLPQEDRQSTNVADDVLLAGVFLAWHLAAAAPSRPRRPPASRPPPAPPAAPVLPPPGSPPLVRFIELAFPRQGNVSGIEPETYLYYIQTKPSSPSAGQWEPYREQTVLDDFRRLWNTNFLDDLSVDVTDAPYDNGVVGKHITFNLEERERIKIVDYEGTKVVQQSKIDETLREKGIQIRLDSFIDQGLVRRVAGVVRDLMAEKGYQEATVVPERAAMPGGPKLVHLTFRITEGPKVKVGGVEFVGNTAFGDGALKKQMKNNKGPSIWSGFLFGKGGGIYQEAKFEEDAERVVAFYRDRGYIEVDVGQPTLTVLRDSSDKKTRWMQLRVPVTEGPQYRVGEFAFDGNKVVRSEHLRTLFKQKTGDVYAEKRIREGLQKAREIYGAAGYWEFTGYPDLQPVEPAAAPAPSRRAPAPLVNVTMRLQEGERYFVNRINFVGNLTTRDNVVRREIRVDENGVFDTEALKTSVRRLNQLGYFKELNEETGIDDRQDAGDRQPGGPHAEARGAEPQPAHLRRRGLAVLEGIFGQLVVPDGQLHGPRREPDAVDAEGRARQQLPGRAVGAVPVRPADQRFGRPVFAQDRLPRDRPRRRIQRGPARG